MRRIVSRSSQFLFQQQNASMWSKPTVCNATSTLFSLQANNNARQLMIQHAAATMRQFSTFSYMRQQQQQQQKEQDVYEAEYIDPEIKEVVVEAVEQQERKRRITASQLPKHTAKEMASYPSVSFYQKDLKQGYRKVNDVARLIRGLNAREALFQLKYCERKIGIPLAKFMKSCMVNCENFHGLNADRLLVKEAYVGRGPYLKRLRYHAKMRHGVMKRKTTHFYLKLVEVPLKENERRLGKHGWHNATWEALFAKYESMRETEEEATVDAATDNTTTADQKQATTQQQ